jgi:hypothetical protein
MHDPSRTRLATILEIASICSEADTRTARAGRVESWPKMPNTALRSAFHEIAGKPSHGGNTGSNPIEDATLRQGMMQRCRVLVSALSFAGPRLAGMSQVSNGGGQYSADRFRVIRWPLLEVKQPTCRYRAKKRD